MPEKKIMDMLQKEGQLLEILINNLTIPVFYKDNDMIIRGCNDQFESLVNLERAEIIGKKESEIFQPDGRQAVDEDPSHTLKEHHIQIYKLLYPHRHNQPHEVLIHKSELKNIQGKKSGVIGVILDISRLSSADSRIRNVAGIKGLPGIYNKTLLEERFISELDRSARYDRPMTIMLISIDQLCTLKESYSPREFTTLLRQTARILEGAIRNSDTISFYPADRFLILLPETPPANAAILAERLRQSIQETAFRLTGKPPVNITVSIGISGYPEHGKDQEKLVKAAEKALADATEQGGNRIVLRFRE